MSLLNFCQELSPTLTGQTCPWLCCCLDRCFCKENNGSLTSSLDAHNAEEKSIIVQIKLGKGEAFDGSPKAICVKVNLSACFCSGFMSIICVLTGFGVRSLSFQVHIDAQDNKHILQGCLDLINHCDVLNFVVSIKFRSS